jgi:transcriptional regulator with GAF, ATPase, and Fis domain
MRDINSLPPPDEPADALAAVVALRLMADRLERKTVKRAMELGWTWAQVAEALGITRQAAHKRHARFIKKGGC